MEFREAEPDYENILRSAGWRIWVERQCAMHQSRTYRRLVLTAIKFNERVTVSADEEFEHGAWRELFELAQRLDPKLKLESGGKNTLPNS